MEIAVNGERLELPSHCKVEELLTRLEYNARFVAVAVNGDCLRRDRFASFEISPGDEIEILSPQAGG